MKLRPDPWRHLHLSKLNRRRQTLHLVLVEAVGDVPDIQDGGRVLRLHKLLLLDPLLLGFQRLHQSQHNIRDKKRKDVFSFCWPRFGSKGITHQEILPLAGLGTGRAPREHAPLVPLLVPQPHVCLPLCSRRNLRSTVLRGRKSQPKQGNLRGGGETKGGFGESSVPGYVEVGGGGVRGEAAEEEPPR